jgi:hypothetical protein
MAEPAMWWEWPRARQCANRGEVALRSNYFDQTGPPFTNERQVVPSYVLTTPDELSIKTVPCLFGMTAHLPAEGSPIGIRGIPSPSVTAGVCQ